MTSAVKEYTANLALRKLWFNFPNWGDDANANMDILDASFGAIGLTSIRGIWDNSTAYVIGDKLIDADLGSVWIALADHTSAGSGSFLDDRTANPSYWDPFGTTGVDILPTTDNISNVGTVGHLFNTIYLDNSVDFGAGDVTFDYAANVVTVNGGDLRVTTAGTNAASVVTKDGTQTLLNKTLTGAALNGTLGATTPATVAGTTGTFSSTLRGTATVEVQANAGNVHFWLKGIGDADRAVLYTPAASAGDTTLRVNGTHGYTFGSTGTFSAPSFSGVGTALTALNASNITSGTIADAYLPAAISVTSVSATFTGNGAGITALNATQLTTGTIPDARLPATVTNIDDLRLGASAIMRFAGTDTGLDTYVAGVAGLGQWKSVCDGVEVFRCTSTAFAVSATGLISTSSAEYGFSVSNANGETTISGNGITPLRVKRNADGGLINFFSGTVNEATISVAGPVVTYGSFCGAHWSQWDGTETTLRGTVLETVDEMCVWPGELNHTLPKCKISDTIASPCIYGVYSHDDEGDDFNVASLGTYVIRIDSAETVACGDYLESAGNGCARVQADDIMRASTIAKVTSTTVIETYMDGSYLVPCTLHCG